MRNAVAAGSEDSARVDEVPGKFVGEGALASAYAVTDLAAASIGCAGAEIAGLLVESGRQHISVVVDRVLASRWFHVTIQPDGWTLHPPWDPIGGDYLGADGWIRLHTNAP